MTLQQVDDVARGRVWLGNKAVENGLVDELGGLEEAVAWVAKEANLDADDFRTVAYPKTKTFQERLLASLGQDSDEEEKAQMMRQLKQAMTPSEMGEYTSYLKMIKELKEMEGVQMRLPYTVDIH
jgi:protease-4